MSSDVKFVLATKKWIESVIIAHNFCPFAKRVFDCDQIHYCASDTSTLESALHAMASLCKALDSDDNVDTGLLIFSDGFAGFDEYLDLVAAAQELLDMSGYEGVYQIASFHPRYCFEGSDENDAANYTNRSPYPMLHLLREASVEDAVARHPAPSSIPEDNIVRARELGKRVFKKLLRNCMTNYQ